MPDRAHNDKLRRTFRVLVMAIGAAIVLVQWISTMLKPHGDFSRHWEFGRRFVHGEFLYNGGLDIPYPPFFALAYTPLSYLPLRVAKPIFFLCGFGALVVILWILDRLTDRALAIRSQDRLWVIAGTLLCGSRFILRDFDDGGQNLILVALTWMAIYLWSRNRDLVAGTSLGLAVALKCTPALFIAYFAWKRQWKIAGLALLMAGTFTLVPALWQTSSYPSHMREWTENILRGFSEPDPSIGILGPEQIQNKSLRPVLARYLMQLPGGHPGRFEGGGYVDFLALPPQAAGFIIKAILLLGLVTIGWLFRKRASRDDPAILWECAAISLLMVLYSPISWGQHCVAAIPALYLIIRSFVSGRAHPSWALCVLGAIAFILIIPNRAIIGRNLSLLLESYHLVTWSLVALVIVLLSEWSRLPNARSLAK
jgi:alpha-1,2-mannosyltransferase